MAYNAYVVHGSKDGTIGVYTSQAKATECALNYCGDGAAEEHTDFSEKDRNWDVRFFGGDTASAEIIRFLAQ